MDTTYQQVKGSEGSRVGTTALLATVYATGFVAAFNENIVNVALLEISESLGVAASTAQWLITGYMIVTSIITASMGFLARRFTTRQLFLASGACLVVGEAACLAAPTFALLLPFRLLQAVGSGIFLPLMMIVVLAVAPRERVGLLLAVGGACITLGPAFGPVLSGLMVGIAGWRGIFVIPLVAGAVFTLVGLRTVRNLSTPEAVRPDAPSLVLLAVGLTSFVFGLSQVTSAPVPGVSLIIVAAAVMALFVMRQRTLDEPLLDIRPLTSTSFWPAALLVVVAMMMTFSMSVLLPLYFEGAFGVSALAAGMLILPAIALNAVTSLLGGRMMDAHGEWPLLPAGLLLVTCGQALVALLSPGLVMPAVVASSVLVYAGVGLVLSPSQTAGLRTLPADQQASGTAIMNTLLMVAASIGSSLFVGLYSSGVAAAAGSGTAPEVAQAAGFSQAVWVATAIAGAGTALSVWYARRMAARR